MSTTLITILGRTPKDANGYRPTKYHFDDGNQTQSLAFFGWALQQRLHPQRMLILGTSGSMWDHLFEGDIDLGDEGADERVSLIEACEGKQVTQAQLDKLSPFLSKHLGCQVELTLIPYARDEVEQVELLRIMANHVPAGESVHLDVTHGFRHLPMLSLLAALYLRIVRNASIEKIWYAAYDPDTGNAPVHDLSGLLRIADGLQALASFDKDGDYGIFVPLLQQAGLSPTSTQALSEAAYFENILNVGEATGKLRKAREAGLDQAKLKPEAELLLPAIRERLNWLDEKKQFEKQTQLARRALERKDYLRATLYAYESVITKLCLKDNVSIVDFEKREQSRKDYEAAQKNQRGQEHDDYKLLKNLRNQVAHGTRGSTGDIQKIMLNENLLQQTLTKLLARIENGELPRTAG